MLSCFIDNHVDRQQGGHVGRTQFTVRSLRSRTSRKIWQTNVRSTQGNAALNACSQQDNAVSLIRYRRCYYMNQATWASTRRASIQRLPYKATWAVSNCASGASTRFRKGRPRGCRSPAAGGYSCRRARQGSLCYPEFHSTMPA